MLSSSLTALRKLRRVRVRPARAAPSAGSRIAPAGRASCRRRRRRGAALRRPWRAVRASLALAGAWASTAAAAGKRGQHGGRNEGSFHLMHPFVGRGIRRARRRESRARAPDGGSGRRRGRAPRGAGRAAARPEELLGHDRDAKSARRRRRRRHARRARRCRRGSRARRARKRAEPRTFAAWRRSRHGARLGQM